MAFEITGHKPGLEGAFVRTQAHTAADALRFACEWAEQGLTASLSLMKASPTKSNASG